MKGMTLEAVTKAVQGSYTGPEEARSRLLADIAIDSRKVVQDGMFVAIKGARVDGNQFIDATYQAGALCCMSTEPPKDDSRPYIRVRSCEQALKDMAEYYRQQLEVKVIGITGSVGKTTTKEMIASVLSQGFDTLKTLGNFNNEIGLPLTVFRLREHHQVAVLEMGISDFGEMSRLAKVARPELCVITNIGQCHLENLGTRDGILKAKTEMFDYARTGAKVILNGDDDKLRTLVDDPRIDRPIYFQIEEPDSSGNADYYCTEIKELGLMGIEAGLHTPAGQIEVTIPAPGRHMLSNALAAAAVGSVLGLSLEQIKAGIEAFEPVGSHGHIIRREHLTILDDCYNANPVSMKAGLDVLAGAKGRKVAFLGDMFELGTQELVMHEEIGAYAAKLGINLVIAIGGLAKEYQKGFEKAMTGKASDSRLVYFSSIEEALSGMDQWIQPEDTVLVKASHAMHFEQIVERLRDMP